MPLIYTFSGFPDTIIEIPHDTADGQTPPNSEVTTWTFPTTISDPRSVAIDSDGNVYAGDNGSHAVYRLNLPVGGGDATIAQTINLPSDIIALTGLAIDSNANLYIAEPISDDIFKIALSSLTFTNDVASPANSDFDRIRSPSNISNPQALAIDSSDILYIADTTDDGIYRIALSSLTFTNDIASPSDSDFGIVTLPSAISSPFAITVDNSGNLYIADQSDDDIYVILANTADNTTATIQSQWNLPTTSTSPSGLAFKFDPSATLTLSTADTDIRAGEPVDIEIDSDIDIS